MNQEHSQKSLQSIAGLSKEGACPLYWVDQNLPGPRQRVVLEKLGLELPLGQQYGLSFKDETLTIAGSSSGISRYRLAGSSSALEVEGTDQGILIHIEGISGLKFVLLKNQPERIPSHAVNHQASNAPVSLLDEYAALRTKELTQPLSAREAKRKASLLREIGDEYRTIHRDIEVERSRPAQSEPRSIRSTPERSGESLGRSWGGAG